MLRRIWHRLFSRKWELLILGVVLGIVTIAGKFIAVEHWAAIDWDLTSYSPWAPILVLVYAVCGALVLYLRRIRSPALWIIFISSLVYGLIMLWAKFFNGG